MHELRGSPADTRWKSFPQGSLKARRTPQKLTFSSILLVVFSRFWEWTRPLASWETGVALAKLRWIRRRRVAKNRRPEREIGVGE